MSNPPIYDVIVMGGGLAGFTLAWQLHLARPETTILVVEKASFPVPEAAHKVGEFTLEMGAFYFSRVLGLKEHLQRQELPKFGVRFFFPAGDNSDIARRVEAGRQTFSKVVTYQLDRGRFENFLAQKCRENGISVWDGCEVAGIELGRPYHRVTVRQGSETIEVQAKWVADASGRRSLLKRQLGLVKPNTHDVNAAWFRLSSLEDITEWSDDPVWHNHVPNRMRWLSTNHLMGKGYWVWLIPLGSGSISVGIVADQKYHPFDRINTFERAMNWLREFEPQCAAHVEAKRDKLQDFRVLKHFSHSCKQVFSTDRWCLTGDAGAFLDPLYSPGSDFIGTSNTLITNMITADLEGYPVDPLIEASNRFYLEFYEFYLLTFNGQYGVFGNPQVGMAKVLWDTALYWSFNALLFFHTCLTSLEFMGTIYPIILRYHNLHRTMQTLFLEWDKRDQREWQNGFVDIQNLDFMRRRTDDLVTGMDDEQVVERCLKNLVMLENICREMHLKAGIPLPDRSGKHIGESESEGQDGLQSASSPAHFDYSQPFPDLPGDEDLAELDKIWLDKFCTLGG